MKIKLFVKKYPQEGDLQHSYSPLKNLLTKDNAIGSFNTNEIKVNLNNPLNIECQPSYDGTVNLIINDDINPPRIINSRFTKIEDNRFRVINRNQSEQTNLYREGMIDLQSRLFRTITKIPRLSFVELNYYGQLKGGNYTFYIKFADSDDNKTDVVCESSQISVFKGNLFNPSSISGTLQNETTDKSIKLILNNIDQSFSRFYVYYTREYSDTNGFRLTEAFSIEKPYYITETNQEIIINGFEDVVEINSEELNIQYNYVTNVKTQAQVQNRLFFGNIENTNVDIKNLQNISYFFEVSLKQKDKSIGWIDQNTYESKDNSITGLEYYDPKNIYYNLGYWPDEIYRLGVVYIMNDDSLSPVFNLRGCEFKQDEFDKSNVTGSTIPYKVWDKSTRKWIINYLERDVFLDKEPMSLSNTFGVFKNPIQGNSNVILDHKSQQVKPWYYQINIPVLTSSDNTQRWDLVEILKEYGVKGFFFVRQKRIPTILCQGLSLGIDKESSIPMIYDSIERRYLAESFLGQDGGTLNHTFADHKIYSSDRFGSALLSVEASVSPNLQSMLDGSNFLLQRVDSGGTIKQSDRSISVVFSDPTATTNRSASCVYMNSDVPYKYVNGYGFSSRAGAAESVKEFKFFTSPDNKNEANNYSLVRGIYAPYIAVCSNLDANSVYNVKISNYSTQYLKDYFGIRRDDNSPFYAISDRFEISDENRTQNVFRGDCFTNTVTVRLNRNFTDSDAPINDTIIDKDTWKDHYNGYFNTTNNDKDIDSDEKPDGNWAKINRGDLNAVGLGMWVTFKCLANRNLGLRSEDRSYPDETALMGNPRTFYPLQDMSVKSSSGIPESFILNDGYSSTVGRKTHISAPNVPYIKDQFDNRIMFSNTQVDGDFRNAYRIFQGLSYKDIDRQYGAIVKLIPWGTNLLCVFEHGLGIVPINEKALIQTSTEQSIHMYGAGVLQNQISLITPDYGSIWPESVIRTPIGIYGVDTYAKKIWRYSDSKGFETISDMKIQRFLNDNIVLRERDKYPIVSLKNVKSHYNNYKGDVMFTFYNFSEGKEWNFCFNERMDKWITRYSWTPLYSENINNVFYSLDKKRAEVLGHIYDNRNCTYGIQTTENEWKISETEEFKTKISLVGVTFATGFDLTLNSLRTSYIKDGVEKEVNLDKTWVDSHIKISDGTNWLEKVLSWNKSDMIGLLEGVDYEVPLYYKIDVTIHPKVAGMNAVNLIEKTIGVVVESKYAPSEYDDLLCNGFYVHGKAGIFDEIGTKQIPVTKWYNKQEPFEFEFVVNNEIGLHKVFENLIIVSNRVQPKSLEFEITGDVYSLFKSDGVFSKDVKEDFDQFTNAHLAFDEVLGQHQLVIDQNCKDIEKVGRRLGNIHYKEDSWYVTIDPIKFKTSTRNRQSTRIRDKYLKVRVKYSGEDQVIITALKTITDITHS